MFKQQSLSQSMARIGRLIHSTLDFDEIMEQVISEAASAVGSETAAISLRQGDHWVVRYVHGFPQEVIGARMDDAQEPHAVLAIETKKPVVIDDAFTDERVNREHMKQWGVRSVLVVPLVTEDQAVGVLFFNQHQAGVPFQKSHVEFAGQLASSLSRAVRNAQGRFLGTRGSNRDITARKLAEEALQEAKEQLQVQNEEVQAQGEELQTQTEELRAQAGELQIQAGELKATNEELRESEQRLRFVLETCHIGAWDMDIAGHTTIRSPEHDRVYGYDSLLPQWTYEMWLAHVVPEDRARVDAIYQNAVKTRSPWSFEYRIRRPDGQVRWIWATGDHRRDADGGVRRVAGIVQDVTERKRAEESLQRAHEELQVRSEELTIANEELREQEQALRDSERLYRAIGESIDYGVWTCAPDGRNTYASESFLKMVGLTQEQCSDFGWGAVLHPDDAERTIAAWKECVRTGGTWDIEHRFRGVDGQWHHVLARGVPVRNERGMIICWAGINLDISRLKRAEAALQQANEELQARSEELTVANEELWVQSVQLQESEQRLRMALEGGQMGRWEWDLATDSMFWCERTFALLGLEKFTKASVETLLDCTHSEDREAVKRLIARVMNEAQDFQAEFRVLRHRETPHNDIAWLVLHAQVIRDEQQRAVRTIGVLYDITSRKEMEAELRRLNERLEAEVQAQTEELRDSVDRLQDEVVRRVLAEGKLRTNSRLLEAFFQHTITPLAFLDNGFSFVRVNEAFAEAAGKPASYFVHKSHFALYPSEEDRVIFEQVVQSRQPYQAFARPFPYFDKPQQPTRYWNRRITPLLDDKGQVQFLVFNLEDVTERQNAFGELEHRTGLLQKLTLELSQAEDRERRRLAEILHDDLQQVLAAAKFHLGLLKSRLKGDEQTTELADQLTRMLKESIEKSRSLSHELSPAVLYQGDLGETFEWLARQVQTKHGLTVHTEVHGKVDTSSEPIKAFLFRAAREILFNTVKHAHVDEARLRLQRRHGQLWLTIADRGRGFDPQALGRTTGFGLFSIRERVELLGGRMRIRSAKGKGSVVVIVIADETGGPRTEGREYTGLPSFVRQSPSSGGPLRILLVDDHKTMRAGLAALIAEQTDMAVVGQAGDGRTAIDLARELLPDVVIMDVAMPTMPGDEATRQIKATRPQARIIALSMFEEPGVARRMRDAGAEVYLPKTGPSEGLLAAIRGRG